MTDLKAPFPYFGGKSSIASAVWSALGQPKHYIEPFFGSGAALLLRPNYDPKAHVETVNDADGHIANVWRALQADPDAVAKVCDWPVNHADLMARKKRINERTESLLSSLVADDKFYDVETAGYWIWAASCWIGNGLVSPNQRPRLSDGGNGVHALGQIPEIGTSGKGVHAAYAPSHYEWFRCLSERLRRVRVVCGDWSRVCVGDWQTGIGTCGMFFDPPYGVAANRDSRLYAVDSLTVADDIRAWCLNRGDDPKMRIVFAGYFEEHESLLSHGWRVQQWKAQGGYGNLGDGIGKENRHREALFFSPHCVGRGLFDEVIADEEIPIDPVQAVVDR